MSDLFSQPSDQQDLATAAAPSMKGVPLAEALRPTSLADVVGQDHILAPDAPLGMQLASKRLQSTLFWGPPGCGKTTIARLLAAEMGMRYAAVSAIFSGVADLKKVFDAARLAITNGQRTLLFVDEIHRFNRAQQDSFLPVVEDGTVVLIGATTENPSFELNSALLSRCQVLVLKRLDRAAMDQLVTRAIGHSGRQVQIGEKARELLADLADGDGRYLLSAMEQLLGAHGDVDAGGSASAGAGEARAGADDTALITVEAVKALITTRAVQYDKSQDQHYNLMSALHKSLRGSDVDAALYWYARMIQGGEDPRYIARRLTRFASEDIGLADPQALVQALSAWQSYERLGSPEGDLALTQAVIYLATAPKSNGTYVAHKAAMKAAGASGSLSPPMHILNAATSLMKTLGYGDGYAYDHNQENGFSGQDYFPENMGRQQFYDPPNRGFERDIRKRLDYWQGLRDRANEDN